jgi:hypothetical protein
MHQHQVDQRPLAATPFRELDSNNGSILYHHRLDNGNSSSNNNKNWLETRLTRLES